MQTGAFWQPSRSWAAMIRLKVTVELPHPCSMTAVQQQRSPSQLQKPQPDLRKSKSFLCQEFVWNHCSMLCGASWGSQTQWAYSLSSTERSSQNWTCLWKTCSPLWSTKQFGLSWPGCKTSRVKGKEEKEPKRKTHLLLCVIFIRSFGFCKQFKSQIEVLIHPHLIWCRSVDYDLSHTCRN